jgi:hypothetical protein
VTFVWIAPQTRDYAITSAGRLRGHGNPVRQYRNPALDHGAIPAA